MCCICHLLLVRKHQCKRPRRVFGYTFGFVFADQQSFLFSWVVCVWFCSLIPSSHCSCPWNQSYNLLEWIGPHLIGTLDLYFQLCTHCLSTDSKVLSALSTMPVVAVCPLSELLLLAYGFQGPTHNVEYKVMPNDHLISCHCMHPALCRDLSTLL